MRKLLEYIMQSPRHAAIAALLFAVVPFFGWVSVVIVALVTLRKGPQTGLFPLFMAAVPDVAFFIAGQSGAVLPLAINVLGGVVLAWGLAGVLRRYESWAWVLEISCVVGIIAVLAIHFFVPDVNQWWISQYQHFVGQLKTAAKDSLSAADFKNWQANMSLLFNPATLTKLARVATGVTAALTLLVTLCNLVIARWAQAVLYNPGALRTELYNIKLGYSLLGILVLSVVLILFGSHSAWDIVPLVCVPFIAAGLSLFHFYVNQTEKAWAWLGLFYVLIVLFPYLLGFVIIAAIIDSIIDLRRMPQESN